MIQKFQIIRNIGVFGSFTWRNQPNFASLTIVYAENGRGKTTLSAIFRSFADGDPNPILERKRLSTHDAPHVVIECDGFSVPAVFENASWTQVYPNIRIFDDCFVHENVHSGLEVSSDHRQNLHQLIIGKQGVELARRVEELTSEISRLHSELRSKSNDITADIRVPYSVEEFCALTPLEGIDEAIKQTQQRVVALQKGERVRTTEEFEPFEPPTVNLKTIRDLLKRTLSDIDSEANQAVQAHFHRLGEQAETWISEGMGLLGKHRESDESCPFCDQSLSRVQLVEHYRAYFSDTYAEHKAAIQTQIQEIGRIFGEDAFMRFNNLLTQQKERCDFWSQLLSVPAFDLNMEVLTTAWQNLRAELNRLLQRKMDSPLDELDIDAEAEKALKEYENLRNSSRTLSRALLKVNEAIARMKEETASGNLEATKNDLQQLQAKKGRFTEDIRLLCDAYLKTKALKEQAENQKVEAREVLDKHRQVVFPQYQSAINEYLIKFGAGFRIKEVQPLNPRGTISSTYQIEIDNTCVQLNQQNPDEPAFKNTLSAGDRNTLALAFYFASLDQEPNLDAIVAIIDDPVSSLDDGRTLTTAQEIRGLTRKVAQVILLSHSKRTLFNVWEHSDRTDASALAVVPDSGGSTIESWNVNEQLINEYDRQHELLRSYVEGTERDVRKVAAGQRLVLEGYLRVVCTEHFLPGTMIGQFIGRARDSASRGTIILSENILRDLELIVEYANKFHHNSNPNSWDVEINNINEQQLKGFVEKVLAFTTK